MKKDYDTLLPDEYKDSYIIENLNCLCLNVDPIEESKIKEDFGVIKKIIAECLSDYTKKYTF